MVVLDADADNDRLTRSAIGLAGHLQAGLVGMAAYQDIPIVYNDGFIGSDIIGQDQSQIDQKIAAAQDRFLAQTAGTSLRVAFRSSIVTVALADDIARHARIADLIVTRPYASHGRSSRSGALNVNDLVIHAGRPLLVVPENIETILVKTAMIAWKDSREARRAVSDALPVLRLADHVIVAALAETGDLQDSMTAADEIVVWLGRQGVEALARTEAVTRNVADQLAGMCDKHNIDLLIGGAYAHSRLQEYVLGGVTRDLLMTPRCCTLMAH